MVLQYGGRKIDCASHDTIHELVYALCCSRQLHQVVIELISTQLYEFV